MSRWSYELTSVNTEVSVADHVPLTGVTFTDSLDGGGSFAGNLPVGFKGWRPLFGNDVMKFVIWPCRDSFPVAAYLVTSMSWSPGDSHVSIRGTRLDAILSRRVIAHDLNFEQVDQFDIWRDLLRYGTGRVTEFSNPTVTAGAGPLDSRLVPWFRLGPEKSGVKRDRRGDNDDGYPASSRKVVGAVMKQLAEVRGGFDVRWDAARDPDTGLPYVRPTLGSPVGRVAGQEGNLVFEFPGGNIVSATYAADGADLTNSAHAPGQEAAGSRPVGQGFAPTLLTDGFPLLESVVSSSSTSSMTELNAASDAALRGADGSWSIELDGERRPHFGSYRLGDVVVFRMRPKEMPDWGDRDVRLVGWSVSPDDTGRGERVTPTLAAS